MNTHEHVMIDRALLLGMLVIVGTTVAACDTSNHQTGIEGTGITNAVAMAAVSRGPIESTDGLDVKVNGVSWSAAAAKITIDGTAGQLLDLDRGTIVTLQGDRTADRVTASAIEATATVRGPIRSVGTGYLDVMGQIVLGDQSTVLDIPGGSLDSLYVGQVVVISGFLTADGEIRATRISTSVRGSGVPWIVSGIITTFDPSRAHFEINGLTVSYSETLLAGLPQGTIAVGRSVVVFGSAFGGDGALLADTVSRYSEALPVIPVTSSAYAAMTGIVYGVEGDSVFHVGGQRVVRPPHVAVSEPIVNGSYVRVTGVLIAGELRATAIIVFGGGRPYMLDGQIEAINIGSQTFRMLGLELFVNEWTRQGATGFSLDSLAVGQWVQVWAHRNRYVSSIGGQWICCVGQSGAESPWFSSVSPPIGFTVSSAADFTVQVTSTTRFLVGVRLGDGDCYGGDVISSDEFWQRAAEPRPADGPTGGTSVFSWGRFEGGILIADDVYLCYPED